MTADRVPSPVDGLVRSPRGLATLSILCGEDLDVWPRRFPGPVDDPRAHPFDVRSPALRVRLDDPATLAVDVISAGRGYAWSPARTVPREAVDEHGGAFLDAARELLRAPGARWWGDDVARGRQTVLGPAETPPDLAARASDQFRMLGPEYDGRIPGVLTTSRRLGDRLPAVGLCSPDLSLLTRGPVGCWAVPVDPGARVFEIHGRRDWSALLTRYPRWVDTTDDLRRWGVTTDRAVVADWEAFAEEWDGVHVSMLGVLTAQSVPVEVGGLEGVLEDVDTEGTAWFRPRFGGPELTATVEPEGLP